MIPHLVAAEIRETLLDYLRSTWQLADRDLEKALLAFLAGERGMFKGPWIRLGLPFALAPRDAAIPLDVKPLYRPYLHQLLAWQRLSSRDGHEPEATIVTTGTGSGKTECFLYPILDHALRALQRREKGIQAIILYPMNALAADQARRMASIVHADDRLRGRLRIGMFVGGKGHDREMGATHCIDDNDHLRRNPPDILLTNYKMLDLLLQRPRDAGLWAQNAPGRLRYLVLDELHTYDGAQGTDVACLVRRLGARLGGAEQICPVGTSATVTGGADTTGELLTFAKRVFDQEFADDAVIGESRLSVQELFEGIEADAAARLPLVTKDLTPAPQEEADEHARRTAREWFSGEPWIEGTRPEDFRGRLGERALRHPLSRALLQVAAQRLLPWETVCREVRAAVPALQARSEGDAEALLGSLLTMLSWSKRKVATRQMPLVSVQVQLWVREVRKLLREVTAAHEAPRFRWVDDGPGPLGTLALPMAYCRDCGHAGWVTVATGFGDRIEADYAEIARAVQERSPDVKYLHQDESVRADDGEIPPRSALDLKTTELFDLKALKPGRVSIFAVKDEEGAKGRGMQKCPACGVRDAMRLLASRSASLTSVAVGHLYTTPLNTDRKLLAFSDSVQDASHRAGFFGGRTYRFALRSALFAVVPAEGGNRALGDWPGDASVLAGAALGGALGSGRGVCRGVLTAGSGVPRGEREMGASALGSRGPGARGRDARRDGGRSHAQTFPGARGRGGAEAQVGGDARARRGVANWPDAGAIGLSLRDGGPGELREGGGASGERVAGEARGAPGPRERGFCADDRGPRDEAPFARRGARSVPGRIHRERRGRVFLEQATRALALAVREIHVAADLPDKRAEAAQV